MISAQKKLFASPQQDVFAEHVSQGLKQPQKRISSEYFYDTKGSQIFQEIMAMPEYYLTRTEDAILHQHQHDIATLIAGKNNPIELVEFGSGDGSKVIPLCVAANALCDNFTFRPMDVSHHALQQLKKKMAEAAPHISVSPITGDYFAQLPERRADSKVSALFLGSNIGNFSDLKAVMLLQHFRRYLKKGELFFLGVDLKKDPEIIRSAYSDAAGITARFNVNLLTRMNDELGFNFVIEQFTHYANYSPLDGYARSFLISKKEQIVYSSVLDESFAFTNGEAIYTEQSRKFSLEDVAVLARKSGFRPHRVFSDAKTSYAVVAWEA